MVTCANAASGEAVRLRSYYSPRDQKSEHRNIKIWEACRATIAARPFFGPIIAESSGQRLFNAGADHSNPINEAWDELQNNLLPELFLADLNCIVSLGVGRPSLMSSTKEDPQIDRILYQIATSNERKAHEFRKKHPELEPRGLYYRFNTSEKLGGVGVEEWRSIDKIIAANIRDISSSRIHGQIRDCAARMTTVDRGLQ
jgi:hypothetical protein